MADYKEKDTEYRDEKGVRKKNYKRFKEGRDYEKTGKELTIELCADFRRGVLGIEEAEDGQQVQKHPGGRPRKYPTIEEFEDVIERYIDHIEEAAERGADLIPDTEGFCLFAGIDRATLMDWQKNRGEEFSTAIKRLLNGIAAWKKQLGLTGKIPPIVLAMDMNNNHGYVQQQNIEIKARDRLQELPNKDEIVKKLPAVEPAELPDDIASDDLKE